MVLMKISSGGDGTKNAIFVDAGETKLQNVKCQFDQYYERFDGTGIHAREWIAPAT
jgi:hypothetical protein